MPDYTSKIGTQDASMAGIAPIDRRSGPLSRWRTPKPANTAAGVSYRYLARQIEADLPSANGGRTILLSSPAPAALSNEASLMLAYFLSAELGARVLLVDGTLGDEGVGAALGHAGAPGFLDVVYGGGPVLSELIHPTQRTNISVLPAGRTSVVHALPMEQAQITALFQQVRGRYDYVLLQQGPIFKESRYLLFTGRADMILMLVEEGGTPVDVLERCVGVFRDHQIANVRLVLSTPG